jgi:hypothetical protein
MIAGAIAFTVITVNLGGLIIMIVAYMIKEGRP